MSLNPLTLPQTSHLRDTSAIAPPPTPKIQELGVELYINFTPFHVKSPFYLPNRDQGFVLKELPMMVIYIDFRNPE